MRFHFAKMPYTGARHVAELSEAPAYLDQPSLRDKLREYGAGVVETTTVRLDPDQEKEYGRWHRMGLACGNLAAIVAEPLRRQELVVGLLGNCTALLGILAGLQRSGPAGACRSAGMLFLDAHGDFNTPETTLSGMLGGMPVAVAAGLCLGRLRAEAGLQAIDPRRCIVMGGQRDLDIAERELIEQQEIEVLSVGDIRGPSAPLAAAVSRLSSAVDAIYVHVDLDVLDAREVPGHHTAVAGGPSSQELAETLADVCTNPKVLAVGIASTPPESLDTGGAARRAAHRLIAAAVRGAAKREAEDEH